MTPSAARWTLSSLVCETFLSGLQCHFSAAKRTRTCTHSRRRTIFWQLSYCTDLQCLFASKWFMQRKCAREQARLILSFRKWLFLSRACTCRCWPVTVISTRLLFWRNYYHHYLFLFSCLLSSSQTHPDVCSRACVHACAYALNSQVNKKNREAAEFPPRQQNRKQ